MIFLTICLNNGMKKDTIELIIELIEFMRIALYITRFKGYVSLTRDVINMAFHGSQHTTLVIVTIKA